MLPSVIKSYNLFIDGRGLAGEAEGVNLPKLERATEGFRGGGMLAEVDIDLGLSPLKIDFTLAAFNAEVLALWGLQSASGIGVRFVAAEVSEDGAGTTAVEISVRGRWKSLDFGEVKGKGMAKLKVEMPLVYYKYSRNGKAVIEIDPIAGIEIVNGVDRTKAIRQAIGTA